MQPGKKREPTLKEILAAQGRLSPNQKPQQKPAQKVQAQAPKARTEEEKKRQAAELAKTLGAQMAPKKATTKEDKLREMINDDPEKAAQMLREMFLKGK